LVVIWNYIYDERTYECQRVELYLYPPFWAFMSCSRVSLTFTFTKSWSYSEIKFSAFQYCLENNKHLRFRRPELRCPVFWHRANFSRRFEQMYSFHRRESTSSDGTAVPRNFWNYHQRNSVSSQKTWIFTNSLQTSNLAVQVLFITKHACNFHSGNSLPNKQNVSYISTPKFLV